MTDANAIKKYEHLKELIAGKIKTGNPIKDDLIVSDAERHLKDLISKRPNIDFEPEPVKEVKKTKKISKEE